MMHISDNLKRIRLLRGFSQQDLADKIGVKRSTYAEWERGIEPKTTNLNKIAGVLGVPVDEILAKASSNVYSGTSEDQKDTAKSYIDDPNLSLQTIHNLSQSNKILAEAAKIKAETDKLREEKEKVLVQSNADLTSLLKSTAHAPEENLLANPHVQMKLLETLAELGVGTLWKTKDDGLILLGNRFAVPDGEALKKESTRVASGKKSIA